MQSGKLDQLVTLVRADRTTRDGMNETRVSWCDYARVWGGIVEETASETLDPNQRQVKVLKSRKFRVRFRGDLRETDRVRFADGSLWDVQAKVDVGGRRRELLLTLALTR